MKRLWLASGRALFHILHPLSLMALKRTTRTRLLLFSGDKLLVVKNWFGSGNWGLPGGGIKRSETPEAALLREVFEEVGISLSPKALQPLFAVQQSDNPLGFAYHCFWVRLPHEVHPAMHRPYEIVAAAWVPRAQLSPLNADPDVLRALAAWPS